MVFARHIILVLLLFPLPAFSQQAKKLRVAVRDVPPFAIKSAGGKWSGISIDLWREIATENQLDYELVEMELKPILEGLSEGKVDLAVGALTVTAEREKDIDFTHCFHTSGLGIAVKGKRSSGIVSVLNQLMTWAVLEVLGGIFLAMIVLGILIYFLERHRNPEQFEKKWHKGIISGIWWSAVTMTTVGYGDKVPRSSLGRILGLLWMFTGIILIATFTAVVSSALTVRRLQTTVQHRDDLYQVRVATVEGSTAQEQLEKTAVPARPYQSAEKALEALARGERDAVVYDAPILKYISHQSHEGMIHVLPELLQRQDYAFALPAKSELREPINRSLLRIINSPEWTARLTRYLGEP